MTRRTLAVVLVCAAHAACTRSTHAAPLRLGTTTTVEQSGALAVLDSLPHAPLRVVVGASGTILRSAAAGDLDVVITHAPSLEQRLLIQPGHAELRCPFVVSQFAIVGPTGDPARVAGAATAADAFRRIAGTRAAFISRADSSGTHVKELSLWKSAGVAPGAHDPWYVQAGVDQAATLRIADERAAYALADLPTFARLSGVDLRVLFTADTALGNPYTLYVIRSALPSEQSGAREFGQWALQEWRPRLLAVRLPGGMAAFTSPPASGECTAPVPAPAGIGR
jgi:tungstate transport system substrate-binding protein